MIRALLLNRKGLKEAYTSLFPSSLITLLIHPIPGRYGFPEVGGAQRGFKLGKYNHLNEVVHPDTLDRCEPAVLG